MGKSVSALEIFEEYKSQKAKKAKPKKLKKRDKPGRPKIHDKTGLPKHQQRFGFIAEREQVKDMKQIASNEHKTIREVFAEALRDYIEKCKNKKATR